MRTEQPNQSQEISWKYLPDTTTLVQYLDRICLIELSKCCKYYRYQLERQVLEKLSLSTWIGKNMDTYIELTESNNYKKVLNLMKNDLGSKLKLVKKITLDCEIDHPFAKKFVELLPNIKTLRFYENHEGCCENTELGLITILNGMKHLQHAEFRYYWEPLDHIYANKQIFPKSLKSLKIFRYGHFSNYDDSLKIYDRLDSNYTDLYSLSIVSNRMIRNLASEMPKLQEVEINDVLDLDTSKLVEFLKANPQLKKLNTCFKQINEEILNTILSSKCLEYWNINSTYWKEKKINSLSSNFSIKHLGVDKSLSTDLAIQFIQACKGLESLELKHYNGLKGFNWSNFEQRINILRLSYSYFTPSDIKEIESSKLFKQIHFELHTPIEKFIDEYNIDKLKNYRFIPSISKYCTLKLINK
ncbi:hypothetical protein CONCODRAFT_7622 [Conidiobolus coronatus NRRL 28638]|uniref:RNI-like protein n=1 Tax=Conidiobolus coronatus (strain ATCC 28846 / CBS 209.66 / NRRL 28638) TaxID=796925 RepID=A0A137P4Q8_CONC2|nr:hypothetical protein CONCODRAFT_7622 [Conidiobolus coronatus NRRL 28638]|eukprot:KXN69921.1 hypothetical protein CONCODRAFT_7622 [Conidiobolus coronatus NRRL 28638]